MRPAEWADGGAQVLVDITELLNVPYLEPAPPLHTLLLTSSVPSLFLSQYFIKCGSEPISGP